MRVLILTPTAFPGISGNAVTAERWRRTLTKKGLAVDVLASEGLEPGVFQKHLQQFNPDILHVHHAFRSGSLLLEPLRIERRNKLGIVVSPGGTDVNEDLHTPGRRESVLRVFDLAGAIVVQNPEVLQRLNLSLPALKGKMVCVPKAVSWFGAEPCDLRQIAGCGPGEILFFLPSGIRPVKRNLECLKAMGRVHGIRPGIRFVAAGPPVENAYAGRFEREVRKRSGFATWIKSIPSAAMRSAYRASDIVLNTSFSEGLSNSVMEAMAAARPVLASDIPGNRWPVAGECGDDPAGLLFDPHSEEDFIEKALRLIDDRTLRECLSRAALSRGARMPGDEQEAGGLIAAYQAALGWSPIGG